MKRILIISIIIMIVLQIAGCQSLPTTVYIDQLDTDMDGLPDSLEERIKTDPLNKDTDNDGLTDYFEHRKYLTNPIEKDSDDDGISDSDWEERKEYTYSITAIVELRPPFNVDHMNDFWQDARIIKELEDDVTRIEVVLYPKAKEIISSGKYEPIDNEYTQPTFSKNYSEEMKKSIREGLKGFDSEIDVAEKLLSFVTKSEYKGIGEALGTNTDLPLQFSFRFSDDGEIDYNSIPKSSKYSKDELMERVFFANSMYLNKTRGACSSTAVLRGGIIRAGGMQEKSIFTIPLIFSGFDDEVKIEVKSKYKKGFINDNLVADHVFNEVLIGGRWIRVDGDTVGVGYDVGGKPYIKILEFNESTDYEFYKYWNYETYSEKRPYKYISVIEQERKN